MLMDVQNMFFAKPNERAALQLLDRATSTRRVLIEPPTGLYGGRQAPNGGSEFSHARHRNEVRTLLTNILNFRKMSSCQTITEQIVLQLNSPVLFSSNQSHRRV